MDIKYIAQLYQWKKSLHHQKCLHLGPQDMFSSHAMHVRELNARIETVANLSRPTGFQRFVAFPACYKYEESGLEVVEPKDYFQNQKCYKFAPLHQRLLAKFKPQVSINYAIVPFDMYCPSLDGKLEKGICKKCGEYWPSQAAMMRHRKCHHKRGKTTESDSDSSAVGLDTDKNDVSEISISDNNFDTEENTEIQFTMLILESISDVI